MSTPDFIGVYDNALTSEECDELISFFESSEKRPGGYAGKNGYNVDHEHKKNSNFYIISFISK